MKPKPSLRKSPVKAPAEQVVKDIRRQTRRHFSAEDKIRIVLEGLRGEDSIAELCRKEGIAQSLYYTWSKEFMEAGKRRYAESFGLLQEPQPPVLRLPLTSPTLPMMGERTNIQQIYRLQSLMP
jgi:transposase-like protein